MKWRDNMAKMTKAQAKRRLLEAQSKFVKVYMWTNIGRDPVRAVKTADMEAVDKIVARCLKRLG
jgi:hypothetical protein